VFYRYHPAFQPPQPIPNKSGGRPGPFRSDQRYTGQHGDSFDPGAALRDLCLTGWEKLKGDQWWEGSAVWYVAANDQLVPWDLGIFALCALAGGPFDLWDFDF